MISKRNKNNTLQNIVGNMCHVKPYVKKNKRKIL